MKITLVVAMAENGVIGRGGELPWRLSTDLKRFKAETMGKPVVMGRKTWESIGRPLPGRRNVVISRNPTYEAPGADVVGSLDEALELARGDAAPEVAVIGGGEIFRQALEVADQLSVTHVLAEIDGDAHFPEIDESLWTEVSREEVSAGEKDDHATRYVVYQRRQTAH